MTKGRRALEGVQVGDECYIRGVNADRYRAGLGPERVTIVKVGPKRVAFGKKGRLTYANIETGRIDDWSRLQRIDDYEAEQERNQLVAELRRLGWEIRWSHYYTPDQLRAALAIAEERT